jgi:hypothetical protein
MTSNEEIAAFFELYKTSPTLILFDSVSDAVEKQEETAKLQICQLKEDGKTNPLDIVLESLVNVVSEDISTNSLTYSKEKVLINNNVRKAAVERICNFIGNDAKKLKIFHDLWLKQFSLFLKQLYESDNKLAVNRAAFLAGNYFRISTKSAIRVMISISK